jgi:hypothetical protein
VHDAAEPKHKEHQQRDLDKLPEALDDAAPDQPSATAMCSPMASSIGRDAIPSQSRRKLRCCRVNEMRIL